MITSLCLSNFKSHSHTELELKPLTILTGINGCGKTSILQALLLLRQSYQKGRLMEGLDLNSPLCDIGVADDALYKLARDGRIVFSLIDDGINYSFQYKVDPDRLTESFLQIDQYSDTVNPAQMERISLFNQHFQYLSAARLGGVSQFSKDTYAVEHQHQISDRNGKGELVGHFLHKFGPDLRYDYMANNGRMSTLYEQVVLWESLISPGVSVTVEQLSGSNGYSIHYGFEGNDISKAIDGLRAENIGFGISYTLPIIVALINAEPGDLLLLENPEAHLHPGGQSALAKLISLVAQRGIQVLVETHSDHIINGIRVYAKRFHKGEAGIDHSKVVVYYFGGKDEMHASIVNQILVYPEGELSFQPNGFFDQDQRDYDYLRSYENTTPATH